MKRGAGYGEGQYGESEESEEQGYAYGQGNGYGKKKSYKKSSYSVAKAHRLIKNYILSNNFKSFSSRLRCSAIAVNSDEDCRKCCHMAGKTLMFYSYKLFPLARKERSISKDSIIGFILDYDEVRQEKTGYQAVIFGIDLLIISISLFSVPDEARCCLSPSCQARGLRQHQLWERLWFQQLIWLREQGLRQWRRLWLWRELQLRVPAEAKGFCQLGILYKNLESPLRVLCPENLCQPEQLWQ